MTYIAKPKLHHPALACNAIGFTRRDYEEVRVDAFTEFDFNAKDKTRTTTMPGGDDTLYYVETRLPDK